MDYTYTPFDGSIKEIAFDDKETFVSTLTIAEMIEEKFPIKVTQEMIAHIKDIVEANSLLAKDFSHDKFIRENKKNIQQCTSPEKLWISYEKCNYSHEFGSMAMELLQEELKKEKEKMHDFEKQLKALEEKNKKEIEEKKKAYQFFDRENALKIVAENGMNLMFLPEALRNDLQIVELAITNDENAFQFAGEIARDNEKLAQIAIVRDPDNIRYVGKTLQTDTDLYIKAIREEPEVFNELPVDIRKKEILLEAVKKDPRKKLSIIINQPSYDMGRER